MFCNQCGNQNADTSKFCQGCGNRLAVEQPVAVAPPPPPVITPVASPVPVSQPVSSRQASVPLAPVAAEQICPNCYNKVGPGKAFCTSCGAGLSGGPARQQPAVPAQASAQRPGAPLIGAGVGIRGVATIIDGILLMIVGWIIAGVGGTTTSSGFELNGAPAFLLMFSGLLYYVLLEGLIGGTIGKMILGLRVVKTDGRKCDIVASIIRNLLRIVDALPILYLIGMITIWVTERKQRIGDLAANTVVIKKGGSKVRSSNTSNDYYDNSDWDSGPSYDYDSSSYSDD